MTWKSHVRWEAQEEGMMSAAASFLSVWNQGLIEPVGLDDLRKVVVDDGGALSNVESA